MNRFVLSKPLEKHWTPRRKYSQSASIQSENLCWLVGVARGPKHFCAGPDQKKSVKSA